MSRTVVLLNPMGTDVTEWMSADTAPEVTGPLMKGTVMGDGDTLYTLPYNNTSGIANIDAGVGMLADKLDSTTGDILVFGYSEGCQIAYKWLRDHGGTSAAPSIDPARLSFLLIGNAERKYGGFGYKHDVFNQVADTAGLPDDMPLFPTVDFCRQYDPIADFPTSPGCQNALVESVAASFGSGELEAAMQAVYNAVSDPADGLAAWNAIAGTAVIHLFYFNVTVADKANVWFVDPATPSVRYGWSPTYPVPMLGFSTLSPQSDRFLRSQIEESFKKRPVKIPFPDFEYPPTAGNAAQTGHTVTGWWAVLPDATQDAGVGVVTVSALAPTVLTVQPTSETTAVAVGSVTAPLPSAVGGFAGTVTVTTATVSAAAQDPATSTGIGAVVNVTTAATVTAATPLGTVAFGVTITIPVAEASVNALMAGVQGIFPAHVSPFCATGTVSALVPSAFGGVSATSEVAEVVAAVPLPRVSAGAAVTVSAATVAVSSHVPAAGGHTSATVDIPDATVPVSAPAPSATGGAVVAVPAAAGNASAFVPTLPAATGIAVIVADQDAKDVVLRGDTQTTLGFTGLAYPQDVTVDVSGAVYVADYLNKAVYKLASGVQTTLSFTGLQSAAYVAVDSAGAVYVTDFTGNAVYKLDGSTQTKLGFTGLQAPAGVAVDVSGAVYVIDINTKAVYKLDGGTQTTLGFTGLQGPLGVAVDSSGAVYVCDQTTKTVYKLAGGAQTTLGFTGLQAPQDVTVDVSGAVYVADYLNKAVYKLAGGTQTTLSFAGLQGPVGVAVLVTRPGICGVLAATATAIALAPMVTAVKAAYPSASLYPSATLFPTAG